MIPSQISLIRNELLTNYQIILDAMLNTGVRVVEFWNLVDNPHWYNSSARVVDLPIEGSTKKADAPKYRTIRLTAAGCKALDVLFSTDIKYRERDAMRAALLRAAIRAGLESRGIMPKMFRKCLASYLVECRKDLGIDTLEICANMGHDEKTLRKNYYGIFTPSDHPEIFEFVKGWNG